MAKSFQTIFMGAASASDQYWIALLGGSLIDEGYGVAVDSSNNIIVCGLTTSDGAGGYDLLVAKYDSSGTLIWDKTLGSTVAERGYGVAVDSSDNIIVCGMRNLYGDEGLIVAKYNSSGALQWDKTLGGSLDDQGQGVTVDSLDNIIVCGRGTKSNGYDLLVAKYNSSGTLIWDKTLGGSTEEFGRSVAVDSSDNIIVCGSTQSDGAGSYDLLVAKYNSSGVLQWDKTLGGTDAEFSRGVAVDSSDNIIVCGSTQSDGAGSYDLLVAKYNSSGTLIWDKTLGGTGYDTGYGVAVDSSDNIIVCGYTSNAGTQFLVAKYNSSGALQWDKMLKGVNQSDIFNDVTVDSSDNVIVCGYTYSIGAGSGDLIVAKLPPDGTGDGTYGTLVYQDASLTSADAVLTDAAAVLTDAAAAFTSSAASLTSADAVLTSELFPISA